MLKGAFGKLRVGCVYWCMLGASVGVWRLRCLEAL